MLLANLAVIDGPRARTVYDKVTTAYNSALLPGTPAIPPFEEWQGVSSCCNNYNCRWVFVCSVTYAKRAYTGIDQLSAESLFKPTIPQVGIDVAWKIGCYKHYCLLTDILYVLQLNNIISSIPGS